MANPEWTDPGDYEDKDDIFDRIGNALRQYQRDMRFPPAADSRERRIAMVDQLLRETGW